MGKKINVEIQDYYKLKRQIERMKTMPEKALQSANGDLKERVPKWIAAGVADRYALEGGKENAKTAVTSGNVGRMKITGSLQKHNLSFIYTGRSLTPVHFSMSPIPKPKSGTPYTLKWKVLRGGKGTTAKIKKLTKKQRKNIGRNFTHQSTQNSQQSPWMLQPTGNRKEGGVNYIPFQRRGQTNPFQYVARAPSLPQMIKDKSGQLRPDVAKHFEKNLEKRIAANINRYIPKEFR